MTAAALMETFRWAVSFSVAGVASLLLVTSGMSMRAYLRHRNDPAADGARLQNDQDAARGGAIAGVALVIIAILVRP